MKIYKKKMKIYKNENEYMKSEIKINKKNELYEVCWGDTEQESVLILCNTSKEDFKRELGYFKRFRGYADVEICKEFEDFLIERGYNAKRCSTDKPTYINFFGCNID